MEIHGRLEALVEEMLDGQILLEEALSEFERLLHSKGAFAPTEASLANRKYAENSSQYSG